jgi:hypothetical protein
VAEVQFQEILESFQIISTNLLQFAVAGINLRQIRIEIGDASREILQCRANTNPFNVTMRFPWFVDSMDFMDLSDGTEGFGGVDEGSVPVDVDVFAR